MRVWCCLLSAVALCLGWPDSKHRSTTGKETGNPISVVRGPCEGRPMPQLSGELPGRLVHVQGWPKVPTCEDGLQVSE